MEKVGEVQGVSVYWNGNEAVDSEGKLFDLAFRGSGNGVTVPFVSDITEVTYKNHTLIIKWGIGSWWKRENQTFFNRPSELTDPEISEMYKESWIIRLNDGSRMGY